MFTSEEKMQLFNRLPALELSYEPKLHKKVYSPLYYIIPRGPKALVWYTYWRDQHICLLILLNERGNYSDIKVFPSCFSDALALGTIIYGTHFLNQQRAYFTCEQLYYYKGLPIREKKKTYLEQLPVLLEMFQKEVEQVAYTTTSLVVGLPVMTENYEEALALMEDLPYKGYGIGSCAPTPPFVENKRTHEGKPPHPLLRTQNNAPFKSPHNASAPGGLGGFPPGGRPLVVRSGLAADTYMLYNPNDNTLVGTAMVPTYKSSVFLNGLFRNIKENVNLDLLEESDDEDEFENAQLDKFVNLDKTILMECVFLKRFQKWQPMKVIKMC